MPDYEVGEAWVSLQPSAKGFGAKAKKDLAEIDLTKSVDLEADKAQLEAAIKQVRGELKALDREKASPQIDFDIAVAEARADELRAKLEELGKVDATPKVNVQIAEATRDLDKVTRQLEVLNERKATVDVDAATAAAQAQLEQLTAKLSEVDRLRAQPRVDADVSTARVRLDEVNGQLRRLSGVTATPDVELEIARARQQALTLTAELDRLGAMRPSVQVDADIAAASAKLALLQRQLSEINGRGVRVSANVDGGGNAGLMVSALAGALGAVAAAGPAAAAGLAAAAGAAGALGQGAGAAVLGLSGISDTLSAVESDEKSAATSSASAASSRTGSANQIANAQASLAQAVQAADRAAITGGQQVAAARLSAARTQVAGSEQIADAARAEQRARQAADRTAITSGEQVAQARRAVADAIAAAGQRVNSAEASVSRAQQSARYAQESLTRARRDAVEANEDLQLSLSGTAIAERRAMLNLRKAQAAAAAGGGDAEELQLDVDEAVQNLAEVRERYGDLRDEQAQFNRTGVDGTDGVVSATRALADAQSSAQDASKALNQAQVDGARQVQDAVVASSQAQRQAAWANADAQDAVRDASIASGRAVRSAAEANADAATQVAQAVQSASWSQADAAAGVESAQRALAQAYETTGQSAASGGKQAAYALSKLSPAGREFVDFLTKEWKPAWEDTSHDIAERMLPGIESGMRSLLSLQPVFTRGLADSGQVIGDLAAKGGALAASAPFRANFAAILDSNTRSLSSMGDAGLSLFGALTDLYTVSLPVIERFTRLADYSAQAFESWIIGERASGDLERSLQSAGDTLMWVGGVLVDVGGDIVTVAGNLAPLGAAILETVRFTTDLIADLTELAGPVGTSLVVGLAGGVLVVSKLGTAMKGLELAQGAAGVRGFANVVGTVLNPAALAATSGMQAFGDKATAAASKVGLSESAATKFGGALTKAGSYLPLVGVAVIGLSAAYDALTLSASESADALLQGGTAAQQAMEKLAWQDQLKRAFPIFQGWVDGVDAGTEAAQRQYDAMTQLQQRQVDATRAQNDYELAVRTYGQNSPQAEAAQGRLATATERVEQAQADARRATMNATEALRDQQDQILGSLDSRLKLESATRSVERAQRDYADAVSRSGADSLEARDAFGALQDAQVRQAEAARQAAADEAKRKGVVDASADSNRAYGQSIGDMVAKTQGELSPALLTMVQSLDGAGLAAAGAKVEIDKAGNAVAVFPNGKTVTLDANTSLALQGLDGVLLKLAQVPGNKTITVGTLAADAEAKLQAIGFTVTHLPNGQVQITATDGQARGTLQAFQAFAAWQVANPQMAADPAKAYEAMRNFLINAGQQTGVPMLDANPERADQQVRDAIGRYNTTWGTIPVGANTWNATAAASKARDDIDSTHGQIHVGANFDQARDDTSGFWGWFKKIFDPNYGTMPIAAGGGLIGGRLPTRAGGGLLRGPGTGTSDSILGLSDGGIPTARVSNGEYVVRAAAVRRVGVPALDAINGLASGGVVGLAAGGQAKTAAVPAPSAAVVAPAGDPAAATAAAGATDELTASMLAAQTAAATLNPALASVAATQTGVVAPATDLVTAGQQRLVTAGITPLVGSMLATLFPTLGLYQQQVGVTSVGANTALQGAQALTQGSTTATALNTAANSAAMTSSTTGMSLAAQGQLANLRTGQNFTQLSTFQLATNNAAQNNAMMSSTGLMSGTNQGHLATLRGAQAVTAGATTAFADSWRAQLGRTVPDSANPIRWVLMYPMRSIVDAWNNLDGQFALGKHVNPVLPNFAFGGAISGPGTGTSDSILARVSDGEFVVRESVASRVPHFLNALNSGQAEAIRAAGGARANPYPGYAAGGVIAAQQFAKSQSGKPYQWGGTGNPSWDCSGFMSGITKALRGQNPFSGRLGTTSTMPWGGFVPGLNGAFTIGNTKTRGHMAGTLAGVNVESGGAHGVHYGPPAIGADNALFNEKYTLPQVGGQFVSGGAGGGAAIDPTPIVDAAFRKAYAEVADVPKFWGPSAQVGRDQGVAKAGADGVRGAALAKLQEMFSAAAMGPLGAGAPFYVGEISRAAKVRGLGIDGATIGVATALVESGLRMYANSKVPGSLALPHDAVGSDHDSVGLFQQRQAGWGTLEQRMNAFASAGMFFDRLMRFNWRAMEPGAAAQRVQVSAFPGRYSGQMGRAHGLVAQYGGAFDNGGPLNPGLTLAYNGTGAREQILDNVETRNYDTLTRLMGPGGVKVDPTSLTATAPSMPSEMRLTSGHLRFDADGLIEIVDGRLELVADKLTDGRVGP